MQATDRKTQASAGRLTQDGSVVIAFFDRYKWLRAILLTAPMAFASFFTTGVGAVLAPTETLLEYFTPTNALLFKISLSSTYVVMNAMLFIMFYTGRIDRSRSILFIAVSVFFPIDFIAGLYELRGHLMTATFENIIHGEVPFCHIVVPQTLLNLVFNREVIFPGTIAKFAYSAGGMIVVWIAASVAIGRGFCSWTCFYGGWEEGIARIAKKPRIRRINPKWRLLPFAVLTAVVLTSVALATSTYCWWLCPFKAVSEFVEVDSFTTWLQTGLFVVLFVGLVIVLPLLTKKRFQCLSFCPFGAFQSLVDKVNVFDIRIATEKCTTCKKCIHACPMNSIDEDSLAKGTTGSTLSLIHI